MTKHNRSIQTKYGVAPTSGMEKSNRCFAIPGGPECTISGYICLSRAAWPTGASRDCKCLDSCTHYTYLEHKVNYRYWWVPKANSNYHFTVRVYVPFRMKTAAIYTETPIYYILTVFNRNVAYGQTFCGNEIYKSFAGRWLIYHLCKEQLSAGKYCQPKCETDVMSSFRSKILSVYLMHRPQWARFLLHYSNSKAQLSFFQCHLAVLHPYFCA